MKKLKIVLIVSVICICGFVIYSSIQSSLKYQNVFDEMYYSYWEDDPGKSSTFSSWRDIEDLEYWSAEEKTFMGKGIDYTNRINKMNKDLVNDKNDEITITFLSDDDDTKGMMYIGYSKSLLDGKTIGLLYSYSVDDNVLKREMSMIIDNDYVDDDVIDKYLEDNNYDKELLYEELDNILYDQVLKDWFQYSDSKFSMDNLGNIGIIK